LHALHLQAYISALRSKHAAEKAQRMKEFTMAASMLTEQVWLWSPQCA
jgi:hypothetical protein